MLQSKVPQSQTSHGSTAIPHINNSHKRDRDGSFMSILCLSAPSTPAPAAGTATRCQGAPAPWPWPPATGSAFLHFFQDRLRPPPGPQCAASPWDRHAERVEVPRVEYEKLSGDRLGEPSAATRSGCSRRGRAGAPDAAIQRHPPAGQRRHTCTARTPALAGGARGRKCGAGRGPRSMRRGRRGAEPLAGGHAAAPMGHPDERPGGPSHSEAGADHR
jgi:hypothetical protein